MYQITLRDGTVLENLELNGNNFISETVIDDAVFEGNLGMVTITDGENSKSFYDMLLVSNRVDGGKSWFILGETPEPTQLDRIEAQVAYTAMMTNTMMEG